MHAVVPVHYIVYTRDIYVGCLPWSVLTYGLPNQPPAAYLAQPSQNKDSDGPCLVKPEMLVCSWQRAAWVAFL